MNWGAKSNGLKALATALLLGTSLAVTGMATAQVPQDVLSVGQIAEPLSLDPHRVTAVNDFRILVNLYEGLVRFSDGTLEVEPALADSWEISEDGTTYTFTLRDGVTFHDGTPFNAEAVKFNFDRMLDENHPYHDTGPFPLSFFFSAIEETEVIDDRTVAFRLAEPYAPLLSNLAYPTGLIVSPTAVMENGADYGRNPVGTGPFQFAVWEANRQVALERNEDYWGGAPELRGVVFRPITDANARVNEMLAGGIDLMVEVPPDMVAQFDEDPDFTMYEQAGPHLWFLILNLREARSPTSACARRRTTPSTRKRSSPKCCRARRRWPQAPSRRPSPGPTMRTFSPTRTIRTGRAKLIAEAGYGDGAEVTFLVTEGGSGMLDPVAMGTAIQADLADVGIDANIETYEWNTFLGIVNPGLEGRGDMAEMAWMTNDPDTLPFLALRTGAFPDEGGFNSGYYSNPEVDALSGAGTRLDGSERAGGPLSPGPGHRLRGCALGVRRQLAAKRRQHRRRSTALHCSRPSCWTFTGCRRTDGQGRDSARMSRPTS